MFYTEFLQSVSVLNWPLQPLQPLKIPFRFLKFSFRKKKFPIGKKIPSFFHHDEKHRRFWNIFFRGDEKKHKNGEGIRYRMKESLYGTFLVTFNPPANLSLSFLTSKMPSGKFNFFLLLRSPHRDKNT